MRNRVVALLTTVLVAIGMTGMTTLAIAGDGNSGGGNGNSGNNSGHHHHHHHHKCPTGTHKVITFKHGKRHKKCVADTVAPTPTGPTAPAAALAISPTSFMFPDTHSPSGATFNDFVVTNRGGSASGVPVASITEVVNPIPGNPAAFTVSANTCTAAVPAGGSCTVTVRFSPHDNQTGYVSTLHVVGSPGGDAQATLSGNAN